MDPLRHGCERSPAHPETGFRTSRHPVHLVVLFLTTLLVCLPDVRLHAMMMVSRSGRMISGPGGEYGFERVSTYWSGLGETRTWRLAAGPMAMSSVRQVNSDAGLDLPGLSQGTVTLRIFGWQQRIDPSGSGIRWAGMGILIVGAASVGIWRKHAHSRVARTHPVTA